MADITRNDSYDILVKDDGLRKKHLTIILNEKINQLKGLKNTLERMKTVDFKKIELQQDILVNEIKELQVKLGSMDKKIIDTQATENK